AEAFGEDLEIHVLGDGRPVGGLHRHGLIIVENGSLQAHGNTLSYRLNRPGIHHTGARTTRWGAGAAFRAGAGRAWRATWGRGHACSAARAYRGRPYRGSVRARRR